MASFDNYRRFIIITEGSFNDKTLRNRCSRVATARGASSTPSMQTVDKAAELLGLFSEQRPEIGLSDMARESGYDKATTRRLLVSLAKHGLVEQDAADRRYRLGPGILRLARVREATRPIASIVQPVLESLMEQTGETAHFAMPSGELVANIGLCESRKASRVTMEAGQQLPVHATATGLAMLAYADPTRIDDVLSKPLTAYTNTTITAATELRTTLARVRKLGHVVVNGYFDADVCSVAAPAFDSNGNVIGSVAVAVPTSRFDAARSAEFAAAVTTAATAITEAMGGARAAAVDAN